MNPRYFLPLVFLAACRQNAEPPAAKTEVAPLETTVRLTAEQQKMAGLELGKIELKNLSNVLQVSGVIDVPPQNLVSISAPAAGFLAKTDLLQGSPVRKGQLLAVIRNPDFIAMQQDFLQTKSEIQENESQLEFLKMEFERQESLARENVNAAKTVQSAKAQYFGTQAKIEGLRAKMGGLRAKMQLLGISAEGLSPTNFQSEIKIFSPINGSVTKVNANVGKFLSATEVLFEIIDGAHQHAELTVFERDVPKLRLDQAVRFTVNGEQRERTAKIHLIGAEISAERTVRVHCHLDREDKTLLPNSFLKAFIEVGNNATTAVLSDAVVHFDGKDFVFLEEKMEGDEVVFQFLEVEKGVSENGFTEVVLPSDLDWKTQKVVTKGAFSLLSMLKMEKEEE